MAEPAANVLAHVLAARLVPNFSTAEVTVAWAVASAAQAGGATVLEYTNRHEASLTVFAEFARHLRVELPGLLLGAGTITTPADAERFIAAGAAFVVGPNRHAGVSTICRSCDVLYIPGCATPTEVATAIEQGAELIKIFPAAQLGGPAFIKALLGPFPKARFMPSGGVTTDPAAIREWFAAGARCLSIGSELFPASALESADWASISRSVVAVLDALHARPA
jgi:2-dehydro-3-deoxyphosphogluconate aldolase/(4S)-4-hydroxy-2-oxoglutarate aldolase